MTTTLLKELASAIVARQNCIRSNNTEWLDKHTETIRQLEADELPRGSGIDRGTKVDLDKSDGIKRIVLTLAYHHMNESGMYDGWTEHQCIITPSLLFGFDLKFTGKDRNDIKAYLHDVYQTTLSDEYETTPVTAQ